MSFFLLSVLVFLIFLFSFFLSFVFSLHFVYLLSLLFLSPALTLALLWLWPAVCFCLPLKSLLFCSLLPVFSCTLLKATLNALREELTQQRAADQLQEEQVESALSAVNRQLRDWGLKRQQEKAEISAAIRKVKAECAQTRMVLLDRSEEAHIGRTRGMRRGALGPHYFVTRSCSR